MKIKKIAINKLNPANYNPRIDLQPGDEEYENIKMSIKKFGYVEPCIINVSNNNTVISGHQRIKVLKELGYNDIDCVLTELTIDEEKALNISLNKIDGIWDKQKLVKMLDELKNIEMLEFTGFDDVSLENLKNQLEEIEEAESDNSSNTYEDNFDNKNVKKITKQGFLYQIGNHVLLCGDSTKQDDVNILFQDNIKVDSLITDPPYGVDYSSKNSDLNKLDNGNRIEKKIENDLIEDYREFFGNFLKIIPFNDYNTFYIAISSQHIHDVKLAIEDCKFKWSDYLIWVKNNHVLGRKDYNSKHEFFVYGWKGKHKFYGDFSTTILEYDRPNKNDLHPTMKPVKLLSRLICDGSKENMIIYDAFGGSGSTLIACEQLKRRCYMIEIDPDYCDVIIQRYIDFKDGNSSDIFLINDNKKIPYFKLKDDLNE
jgi:DNA modification methylase